MAKVMTSCYVPRAFSVSRDYLRADKLHLVKSVFGFESQYIYIYLWTQFNSTHSRPVVFEPPNQSFAARNY
jgi:hypothetical protein